jgi:hypothetical protein
MVPYYGNNFDYGTGSMWNSRGGGKMQMGIPVPVMNQGLGDVQGRQLLSITVTIFLNIYFYFSIITILFFHMAFLH